METIEKTIEVDAPLHEVYNQWTQFEEFPKFMEGVEAVQKLDEKHLHWVAQVAGQKKEWDAEIVEQVPDQRIAWRSTGGAPNTGTVMFQPKSDHTMITLRMNYEPQGAMEKMGDAMGMVSSRIEGDLKRFQQYIEHRGGTTTGGWRGSINDGQVNPKSGQDNSSGQSGVS
jgi:uncharacterized membrane protein